MITDFWSLLNISSKQIQWILDKAAPDITLSKQSIILDSDNLTDTFLITTDSDENLSIISSNDSIAVVSLSDNNVTITAVANGTCTITINVAESSNYIAGTKTLSVNVQLASNILNDNSWDTIKTTIQSGEAASLWNVGDTKDVALSGTIGTVSISGTYKVSILGFNHNASVEGNNRVHFILGKNSSDVDIVFCDSILGNRPESGKNYFRHYIGIGNTGGWENSDLRTLIQNFTNILPTAIANVINPTIKWTAKSGNTDKANAMGSVSDKIFLLSEYEVFGKRGIANQYEKDHCEQYDYYKNGNSKIRYIYNNPSVKVDWWTRSPCYYNQYSFSDVDAAGNVRELYANHSLGLAPAFSIG